MPSIATAVKAAEVLETPAITVTPEHCARYRHRKSSCEYCLAVCPAGAVSFDQLNAPVIDTELCMGCGACATVCPAGALEHARPGNSEAEADVCLSIEAKGEAVFACLRAGDVPGAVRVPCLARVDASLILAALASGARCVRLVSGECENCPSAGAGALGCAMADTAASLASALGYPGAIVLAPSGADEEEAALGPALSRRAFFLMLSSKGMEAGHKAAGALIVRAGEENAPDPRLVRSEFVKHVPASRSRLTSALVSLAGEEKAALDGFLFSVPAIDAELCQGCSMCARVCPTGALEASRKGAVFTLMFDVKTCTSCYLCEDVCPHGAIMRSEGAASELLTSHSPLTVVCKEECEDPLTVKPEEKLARLFTTFVSHA